MVLNYVNFIIHNNSDIQYPRALMPQVEIPPTPQRKEDSDSIFRGHFNSYLTCKASMGLTQAIFGVLISGVCILLRVLDQVEEFPSNTTLISIVFYYFIQLSSYMFRLYNHLQAEIYAADRLSVVLISAVYISP
jgi:hypothetical protein